MNPKLIDLDARLTEIENLLWPPAPNSINVGDIVYWTGSERKTISPDRWISTLGTPIGVVTIPDGFAPDGKARMVALSGVTSTGAASNIETVIAWGSSYTDTSLTNYTKVPTTDNAGSTSTGSNTYGYLPSDRFTGTISYVDSVAKYYYTDKTMIPSPYKIVDGITYPNPEYYKTILSGEKNVNALSDFNGLQNTQTLVGLGSGYAANACWNYKDTANSGVQWYLPACGELGYMIPRFNIIDATLTKLNAVRLSDVYYWSSSEHDSKSAYLVEMDSGSVSTTPKNFSYYYTRPWATLA